MSNNSHFWTIPSFLLGGVPNGRGGLSGHRKVIWGSRHLAEGLEQFRRLTAGTVEGQPASSSLASLSPSPSVAVL